MNRRRIAWIAASAGLTVALVAMTVWLVSSGTRGAEIANVLALPVAVVSAVIGVVGIVVVVAGKSPSPRPDAPRSARSAAGGGESEPVAPSAHSQPAGSGPRAMTKELFFTCGAPAPLHDAAAELRRTGFLVRRQPRDVDGTWWLEAYSAASELSEEDLAVLDDIAVRCGVVFDGWGTYLGPPDHDTGPGDPAHRTR